MNIYENHDSFLIKKPWQKSTASNHNKLNKNHRGLHEIFRYNIYSTCHHNEAPPLLIIIAYYNSYKAVNKILSGSVKSSNTHSLHSEIYFFYNRCLVFHIFVNILRIQFCSLHLNFAVFVYSLWMQSKIIPECQMSFQFQRVFRANI